MNHEGVARSRDEGSALRVTTSAAAGLAALYACVAAPPAAAQEQPYVPPTAPDVPSPSAPRREARRSAGFPRWLSATLAAAALP